MPDVSVFVAKTEQEAKEKIIASLSFLKFKYKKSAEADFNFITFNNLSWFLRFT